MKDHHLKGGNGIKRAVRSAPADNGRIPHHIYNNDIKRFQARKYSNEIKKKELEKKVHEKSSMLRKYAKLCAREGIISDRVHIGTRSDDNTTASNDRGNSSNFTDGLGSSNSSSANKKNQHQLPKPNHFAKKVLKQAQQLLKEKEEKEQQFQEKLHHKEEAMKLRLKKHKAITQKTTKGQPVLNNQIKLLLEKLQK